MTNKLLALTINLANTMLKYGVAEFLSYLCLTIHTERYCVSSFFNFYHFLSSSDTSFSKKLNLKINFLKIMFKILLTSGSKSAFFINLII